jgi:magnesium chelatase family protein
VVRAMLPGDAAVPLPTTADPPPMPPVATADLREVRGQAAAKRALEVAAAGRHSLLMVLSLDPYRSPLDEFHHNYHTNQGI